MGYILGLDIGITSIGYAVLATDATGVPYKILCLNTVIFSKPENPKNGASLATDTRKHRGSRRNNRRSKFRKLRVRQLFLREGLVNKSFISKFLSQKAPHQDIWKLRRLALTEPISNEQVFEVLYYFAGHRGFKSNRRSELKVVGSKDSKDKEDKKVLSNINENKKRISDFESLGTMMADLPEFQLRKHNKDYQEEATIYPLRKWLVAEVNKIITKQRELGNAQLTSDFSKSYLSIFESQRDFDEGPASPSRFGGNLIERMVGIDSLDPNEKRAAKLTNTFFRFKLLSDLNNLQIRYAIGQSYLPLTVDQRQVILKATNLKSLTFAQIRKKLSLDEKARFNLVTYDLKKTFGSVEKNKYFFKKNGLATINELVADSELVDQIGTALSYFKGDAKRKTELTRLGLNENQIDQLLPLQAKGFGHLSLKTMKAILPYLEQGMIYNDAADKAGYDFKNNKVDRQYLRNNIKNPVVSRAIAKTLKVVKAVINRYGNPDAIHLELTREIKHNFKERSEIKKQQDSNASKNNIVAGKLEENGIPVNGINITKQKLYDEQHGIDLYTGRPINSENLFSDNSFQVDHIVAYSKSFNDSFTNKVVTATHCNQAKANQTPLEYLGTSETAADEFRTRVLANIKNPRKRQNLLKEHFTEEDRRAWKSRNINDTGYINRVLGQYFRQNISFSGVFKSPVVTINGATTAYIRKRYGISKNRQASDLHHAVDAVVLGCITPKFIRQLTEYSEEQETKHSKQFWQIERDKKFSGATASEYQNRIKMFPQPWLDFRDELLDRLSSDPAKLMFGHHWEHYSEEEINKLKPAMVIRTSNHRVTGPAHEEKIYSSKIYADTGMGQIRVPINSLKYDEKNDAIKGYALEADGSNQVIYEALKERLKSFANFKANKAEKKSASSTNSKGSEPFPANKLEVMIGNQKQIVSHVKISKPITLPVKVGNGTGLALNGSMLRVDIFRRHQDNQLVGVPVYVSDSVKHSLPNRAVWGSSYSTWYEIQPSDKFILSIAINDLIEVHSSDPLKLTNNVTHEDIRSTKLLCYFDGFGISKKQVAFQSINGDFKIKPIVLNKIISITRFQIDYLGNFYPIKHEHRSTFN